MEYLALMLAMTCVSEIDFQPSPAECMVMWSINDRTARRRKLTIEQQTLAFNSFWDERNATKRPWIANLRLDGERPDGFPENLDWEHFRPMWTRYLNAAKRYATEPRPGICRHANDYAAPTMGPACDGATPILCLPGQKQAYWDNRTCKRGE